MVAQIGRIDDAPEAGRGVVGGGNVVGFVRTQG
jgi:hypothetical protein